MLFYKRFFSLSLILFFLHTHVFAAENIVFYMIGEQKASDINMIKRYFEKKKFKVNMFNLAGQMEKHLDNINKINSLKASMLIALNLQMADNEGCFIAIYSPSIKPGIFKAIEEAPGFHGAESKALAGAIASSFNIRVKEMPLLPLIGVDMPSVFMNIQTNKDRINIAFDKLYSGIENYLKRGKKDER